MQVEDLERKIVDLEYSLSASIEDTRHTERVLVGLASAVKEFIEAMQTEELTENRAELLLINMMNAMPCEGCAMPTKQCACDAMTH
jgi:hypothetical protein